MGRQFFGVFEGKKEALVVNRGDSALYALLYYPPRPEGEEKAAKTVKAKRSSNTLVVVICG